MSDDSKENASVDSTEGASESEREDSFLDMPEDGDALSASASRFFAAQYDTLYVFHLLVDSVVFADRAAVIARRALDDEKATDDLGTGTVARESPAGRTRRLREHRQVLLEMMICRIVDGFATYLSEIVREVLHSRPELLRSRDQIRVDYALSFPSMDALSADLIDRKVLDLSYRGFVALETWWETRLATGITARPDERQAIIEVLETRNCIVHNRGVVGTKYIRTVAEAEFKLGDPRRLSVDYMFDSCRLLFRIIRGLDCCLIRKFGLSETAFDPDSSRSRRLMLPSN